MGRMNFRNPYEFDPYDADGAGGLLGMLQAMCTRRRLRPVPASILEYRET
jgi:hypothetical protein